MIDAPIREDTKQEVKTYKIVPMNEILRMEKKEEPFILQDMIVDNSINCITAESGKGKSLLMLKMIESIVRGEKFLDTYETKKTKTLIIDLEMSENDIIDRSQSVIQTDIEGLDSYHCQEFNIEDQQDYEWLTKAIKENDYKLIVFDALSAIHLREENSNSDMNLVNMVLLKLTHEFGVTILFIHHHRKPYRGEQMSMDSSRGAGQIVQKAASQILLDSKDISYGQHMTVEQGKRRQKRRLKRFGIDITCDENDKTSFIWTGTEEKKETATEEGKNILLNGMEPGRKYLKKELIEEFGIKLTALKNITKDLVDNDLMFESEVLANDVIFFKEKRQKTGSKLYFIDN